MKCAICEQTIEVKNTFYYLDGKFYCRVHGRIINEEAIAYLKRQQNKIYLIDKLLGRHFNE